MTTGHGSRGRRRGPASGPTLRMAGIGRNPGEIRPESGPLPRPMCTSPTSGIKPAVPAGDAGNARIARLRAGAPGQATGPSAVGGVRGEGAREVRERAHCHVRERPSAVGNARIGRPRGRTRKRPKELVGTSHSTGPEATASRSPKSPPGSSLADLATIEPGSRDRSEDRSPVRSGGSHLPLRARRNVRPGVIAPQGACPRTWTSSQ
jgi:hypothetical protein